MGTATIFEAKTTLSELIKQVQTGDVVVITSGREKIPVAKLVPIDPIIKKRLGILQNLDFILPASFDDPLPEGWNGEGE